MVHIRLSKKDKLLAQLQEIEEKKAKLVSQFLNTDEDDEFEPIAYNRTGTVLLLIYVPASSQPSLYTGNRSKQTFTTSQSLGHTGTPDSMISIRIYILLSSLNNKKYADRLRFLKNDINASFYAESTGSSR